jgi:hypothetical protein
MRSEVREIFVRGRVRPWAGGFAAGRAKLVELAESDVSLANCLS